MEEEQQPPRRQQQQLDHESELDPMSPAIPSTAAVQSPKESQETIDQLAPIDAGSETPTMAHDSLVTVRLSEPPGLSLDTTTTTITSPAPATHPIHSPKNIISPHTSSKSSSRPNDDTPPDQIEMASPEEMNDEQPSDTSTPTAYTNPESDRSRQSSQGDGLAATDALDETSIAEEAFATATTVLKADSDSDHDQEEVDWEELRKSEDKETKTEGSESNTTLLLARLEQENAKLAINTKIANVRAAEQFAKPPRPPSMAQLRDMVSKPIPPALQVASALPSPPLTDLDFYTALVQDYRRTAEQLPMLLSNKVRKGIPPPLRGVVWQSMSGARDTVLEERFDRLSSELESNDPVTFNDLGRIFPSVNKFREPDGEGQRMLSRVLKCYGLHDPKIGYCQGLAFLVGPLLMQMSDKAAFCVLARLMDQYDLRSCFLPEMPGLHVKNYQFRELLVQMLPDLSTRLDELQVDLTYVSQWFLSFFAVTSPLPMLFRIYDVIFAEGVSESLMRVALCLMRKNQRRLLACTEVDDALQLLLSRTVWDCYHYNADEFVQDFVSLTDVVTREKLDRLDREFRELSEKLGEKRSAATSANASASASALAARSLAVTSAANRFVGRIGTSDDITTVNTTVNTITTTTTATTTSGVTSSPKQATLSPIISAPSSRPFSMLRRTASKQSLASTLNSMDTSSVGVVSSSASTAPTTISRDSSAANATAATAATATVTSTADRSSAAPGSEFRPVSGSKGGDERYLHNQIEDLLMALNELQRNQAILADELQIEREEREEDRTAARTLLDSLRKKLESRSEEDGGGSVPSGDDELFNLVGFTEQRFGPPEGQRRPSISSHSKSRLRDELAKTKEQLATAMSHSQHLNRKILDLEQNTTSLRDQLRESHSHVRTLHQDKQRLEKQVHNMRVRISAASDNATAAGGNDDRQGPSTAVGGLRELKLGRTKSTMSQAANSPFTKRMSSLATTIGATTATATAATTPTNSPTPAMTNTAATSATSTTTTPPPASENDALLLELVQAKTAEAIARQEADEIKLKLESLKKAYGLALGGASDSAHVVTPVTSPSPFSAAAMTTTTTTTTTTTAAGAAASAAMGVFGRLTGNGPVSDSSRPATASTATSSASGGFWGWRR